MEPGELKESKAPLNFGAWKNSLAFLKIITLPTISSLRKAIEPRAVKESKAKNCPVFLKAITLPPAMEPGGMKESRAAMRKNRPLKYGSYSTFLCFPLLPLELRAKIWRANLRKRIVYIYPELSQQPMQAGKDWICKIRGEPIGELAAFLACREARIEMLRPYTKFACVQSRTPMTEGRIRDQYLFEQHYRTYKHEYLTHDSVTYVDLRRDMIFLGSGYFPATFDIITSFLGKHLGEVRSLAISFEYCQYKEVYSRLRNLGRLEELIFVASPERRRTWPGGMTRISLQNIELTSRPLCDIDFLLNDISTGYYDPDTKLNYPRVSLADYKKIPCDITREWEIVRQE